MNSNYHVDHHNPIKYTTLQYNIIQYNETRYYTTRYNTIHRNTRYKRRPSSTIQYNSRALHLVGMKIRPRIPPPWLQRHFPILLLIPIHVSTQHAVLETPQSRKRFRDLLPPLFAEELVPRGGAGDGTFLVRVPNVKKRSLVNFYVTDPQ